MYFLEERIEDLLGPGKGHGVNRMWKCPWHEEKHASLSINVQEGVFFCFGCGKKGNYETLCTQFGEIPDDEYKWERAKRSVEEGFVNPTASNISVAIRPRGDIQEGNAGSNWRGHFIEDFLRTRGIRESSATVFGVGTVDARIAFPYYTIDNDRILGIKYRHPDGSKTAESGSSFATPFGISLAVGKPDVFIFEGESDTLRGHTDIGDKQGVGVCGTSGVGVSESQWIRNGLNLLFAKRIFLVYDNDTPGNTCAETAMRVLGTDKCIRLTPKRGKDYTEHVLAGGTMREMM